VINSANEIRVLVIFGRKDGIHDVRALHILPEQLQDETTYDPDVEVRGLKV